MHHSSRRRLLLISSLAMSTAPLAAQTVATETPRPDAIPEIVVTATKRSESVRSIAGSITALTGEQLAARGAKGLEDAIAITPGAILNKFEPGFTSVTLRGIATGSTGNSVGQEPTGYYINDIPLTDPTINILVPDIDNFDVGDITILRGPQGTLFGSGALGGSINYRAAEPDFSGFHLKLQGSVEAMARSSEIGGGAGLMVNAPLVEDRLAARLVLIARRDAGFVDNIGTGRNDSNGYTALGGRLLLTWKVGDSATLKYLGLLQTGDSDDRSDTFPGLFGDFARSSNFPENFENRVAINSLRYDREFGFGTLTVIGNYHAKRRVLNTDNTQSFSVIFGEDAAISTGNQQQRSFGGGGEIRLASAPGGNFDYVVGVMHDTTTVVSDGTISAPNAAATLEALFGELVGPGIGETLTRDGDTYSVFNLRFKGRETAAFGEASYRFTPTLKLTLGGRLFHVSSQSESSTFGLIPFFTSGEIDIAQGGKSSATGFNPKASLTFTPSSDVMAYALVSKGFRFGGPNFFADEPGFVVPPSFGSDSLINYELGLRTSWLENRLQLDVNLFYVDWSNVQVTRFTPGGNQFADNAGSAVSKGVEFVGRWNVTRGLSISNSITYLDAKLTETVDDFVKGDVLPGAAKWKLSTDISIAPPSLALSPVLLLSHRYVSEAPSLIGSTDFRQGDFHVFDARLSVDLGRVGLSAYVRNIGNVRGVALSFPTNFAGFQSQYVERPRTFGLTLTSKW